MARMRYRSGEKTKSLREVTAPRDRAPKHAGDAPIVSPKPPKVRWSLETYPYPDPRLQDADDGAA